MTMINKLIGTDRNASWKSPSTGEMILPNVYRKSFTSKHTYIEYNNLESVLPIKNSTNISINVIIIEIFEVILFSKFFCLLYFVYNVKIAFQIGTMYQFTYNFFLIQI